MTDSGHLLETLKSMILDFQEMDLETGVARRLRIETVPGKATVCIGVRRSGKSTYLYQLIAGLLEHGVPRRNTNPKKGVLHRSCPDRLGVIGDPGQLRPPAGELGVHGAAAPARGDPLLPDANRARGRFRGAAPGTAADAGTGMRVAGRSANPEAGDRRAGRSDGGTGRPDCHRRHPQRTGADRDRGLIEVVPAWRFLLETDPASEWIGAAQAVNAR